MSKPIPRTYDDVFREAARAVPFGPTALPVAYMRALAWRESGLNPKAKTGSHWGLFQVGPATLADANKGHRETLTHDDMLAPSPNAQTFVRYYVQVIDPALDAAADSTPRVDLNRNLERDWSNPEYALLVTASWNSGPYAVRDVAKYLIGRGVPVTHAEIFATARRLAGSTFPARYRDLFSVKKQRWQLSVVKLLATGATVSTPSTETPKASGGGGLALVVVLLLLLAGKKSR